jgi:HD-GYP domain-containing protein (c-di-GMP phosphodiesterase class II)
MPVETWIALGAMAAATLLLLLYAYVLLPREVRRMYLGSLQAFATAVELRAPRHRGQTVRVAGLAEQVALELQLEPAVRRRLQKAVYLRDIGMCAIPFDVLNLEPHHWTPEQAEMYDRHAQVSGAMLEVLPSLRELSSIVRCHHAWYDGESGAMFPVREDLPVEARIICAVTAFAVAERALGALLALEEVRAKAGAQFDPSVAAALSAVLTSERARTRARVAPTP